MDKKNTIICLFLNRLSLFITVSQMKIWSYFTFAKKDHPFFLGPHNISEVLSIPGFATGNWSHSQYHHSSTYSVMFWLLRYVLCFIFSPFGPHWYSWGPKGWFLRLPKLYFPLLWRPIRKLTFPGGFFQFSVLIQHLKIQKKCLDAAFFFVESHTHSSCSNQPLAMNYSFHLKDVKMIQVNYNLNLFLLCFFWL